MSGSLEKIVIERGDIHSAIRFVEHAKLIIKHFGLIPVVILVNEEMHFDVFCENVAGDANAISNSSKEIINKYENPSFSIYKYENYESVIDVMIKNKTEVFWECLNNWRVKS